MLDMLRPLKTFARPHFQGLDRITEARPVLFVGNHTLFGLLDLPFMFAELYRKKGIFLRSLGDHVHFKIPFWREWLAQIGTVDGTRENCSALMRAGEAILVFPGGAREVAKRRGEKYQLVWGDRMGFAKMALRHGCTIQPFAAVGIEDAFEIVRDAEDFFATPLGRIASKLGLRHDFVPPLVRAAHGGMPRFERLYFAFGDPIPPKGSASNERDCRRARDATKHSIEGLITELRDVQRRDPNRYVVNLGRKRT